MPWIQYNTTTNLVLARQAAQGAAQSGTSWEETTQFELEIGWYRNGANDFTPTKRQTAWQVTQRKYQAEIHGFALIAENDIKPVWSAQSGSDVRYLNTVAWAINWVAYAWKEVADATSDTSDIQSVMTQIRAEFAIGMRPWYGAHQPTIWAAYRNAVYSTTGVGGGLLVENLGNAAARQSYVDTNFPAALSHQG